MTGKSNISTTAAGNAPELSQPRIIVACISCRGRKIKCSGTAPCESCSLSGNQCIIDDTTTGKGKKKNLVSRKVDESKAYKWLLEGLLICLRYSRGPGLVELLDGVKEHSPLRPLAVTIFSVLSMIDLPEVLQCAAAELKLELNRFLHGVRKPKGGRPSRGSIKQPESVKFEHFDYESFGHSNSLDGESESRNESQPPNPEIESPQATDGSGKHISSSFGSRTSTESEAKTLQHPRNETTAFLGLEDILVFLNTTQNPIGDQASVDRRAGVDEDQSTKSEPGTQASLPAASGPEADVQDTDHLDSSAEGYPQFNCGNHRGVKRPHSPTTVVPPRPAPFTPQSIEDQNIHPSLPMDAAESQRFLNPPSTFISGYDMSARMEYGPQRWIDPPQSVRGPAQYTTFPHIAFNVEYVPGAVTNYLEGAHQLLSQGYPIDGILGPERPYVDLLFQPRTQSDSHFACHFASELCNKLEGMEPTTRLGIAVVLTYLIRWFISPSHENDLSIPDLRRSNFAETEIPDSAEFTPCPFPRLLEALSHKDWGFLWALARTINYHCQNVPVMSCIETVDDETGSHYVPTEDFITRIKQSEGWMPVPSALDPVAECPGTFQRCVLGDGEAFGAWKN
ncbi:hypothetical protein PV08_02565 [Exophiala spinifera]|uniref:Zn(2)-C6 fungal-type domain-containing protein n=1 Tax=Exophiala spinifera TaxID=91928 RepID=A0A0D1ZZW7_9EURO|nr:uncharacterized protein PV08_02565 [Exophiala spinifera]KIW18277.1 hypothetical protein PV08_02565 [Exophiala spinifera]